MQIYFALSKTRNANIRLKDKKEAIREIANGRDVYVAVLPTDFGKIAYLSTVAFDI
jgi:hypothetical protein